MSTTLCWLPVLPEKPNYLGCGLKWAIKKHYDDDNIVMTMGDVPFLQGVLAAQTSANEMARNCEALIAAIREHGSVRVWEE